MSIIRGPFTLKWGDNVITDVEEISVEHEVDSEDFKTLQGASLEIDGAYKTSATITLLSTDIGALAALVPQNFVPNGSVMSTGETVKQALGAIDVAPAVCTTSTVYNNLDIISCGSPSDTLRIVNARTRIDSVEVSGVLRKVMVKFIGEPASGEATMQFFKTAGIAVVS